MPPADLFATITLAWIALAIALMPIQLRITAPYGRHGRAGWGLEIPNRLGWFLMEIVSPVVFATLFLSGPTAKTAPMWVLFALWVAHYLHRSLVYPWLTRTRGKTMPAVVAASAAAFNMANAGLNGVYLGWLAEPYPPTWFGEPNFVAGAVLFILGAGLNIASDYSLISLRKRAGGTGYLIPRGPLFARISCPNHFGEIVEWIGYALMCWSLPALGFAIWTATNLIPRALSHHAWYRERFADYPPERRAVIPFVL